jgi:hypothetical protein
MLALFVTAVLMTSIAAVTIPAASALTARTTFNDNHYTASRPGGAKICGDHKCAPGEYDQMQKALAQAQMKGKTSSTVPSMPSTTMPTTPSTTMPTTPSTTMPTMNGTSTTPYHDAGVSSICETVKTTLTSEGTSPATIAKLLAALGCS